MMIYMPFMWFIAPALVWGLTGKLRRRDEPIYGPGTALSLILAFGAYWYSKVFFLPNLLDYVPFSAWLPMIPEDWYMLLRIGVPLVTTVGAAFLAWWYTYGQDKRLPFFTLLIFMGIDSLVSISVYGVIFYSLA